jgi:HD-GYP domain-containing protein (c-di-GMP phosphodiesterase class II)
MDLSDIPANTTENVLLSDIIGSLSYALDLTEGLPAWHSLRSCWIGMHIGMEMGMNSNELSHLYYTLLLKDAGCSSNAARLFELYGNDDRAVKRDFKLVDSDSLMQLSRFVLANTAVGRSLHERVKRIMSLAQNGSEFATELIATRCERGADIARQLGFDEAVSNGVRHLDEHWNGNGKPYGLSRRSIPINSRLALLSQVIDVFHSAAGPEAALREAEHRAGSWFDPDAVKVFYEIQSRAGFWEALRDEGLQKNVSQLEPESKVVRVDEIGRAHV